MRKIVFALFVVFSILVIVQWISNSLQSFFGYSRRYTAREQLKEIDLGHFSEKIKKNHVSQGYGATFFAAIHYIRPWHNGIDIVAPIGTPILSPSDGVVLARGDQDKFCYRRGYGKFIAVKDTETGTIAFYAHLSKFLVDAGKTIHKGNVIGLSGRSGFATAPHLHFSIFKEKKFTMDSKRGCGPTPEGKDINPINYLESILSS
ncbi:MAG: M23 family metallopeptidase [Candidatus Liptonbacteria bacterium]|nr:M23 family metallopeptidase [Candidatus Liptonbacteria bacterium]